MSAKGRTLALTLVLGCSSEPIALPEDPPEVLELSAPVYHRLCQECAFDEDCQPDTKRMQGVDAATPVSLTCAPAGPSETLRCQVRCDEAPTICPVGFHCEEGVCRHEDGDCPVPCLTGWDDCDRSFRNGCEEDLSRTDAHCGECGHDCADAYPHGLARCESFECHPVDCSTPSDECAGYRPDGCEPGWRDCDGARVNGCEAHIDSDVSNCGACEEGCHGLFPHVGEVCLEGACQPKRSGGALACHSGWADCTAAPGCETMLGTVDHCGGCNKACPHLSEQVGWNRSWRCVQGKCHQDQCLPGWVSCTSHPDCEVEDLGTATHCGCTDCTQDLAHVAAELVTCEPVAEGAALRRCQLDGACKPGYGDCNGYWHDGCETSLEGAAHCGECYAPCGAGQECEGSVCQCGGLPTGPLPPHVHPLGVQCVDGAWSVVACEAGWLDCALQAPGCETPSSVSACGACNVQCGPGEACASGTCLCGQTACGDNQQCEAGECSCVAGYYACGQACLPEAAESPCTATDEGSSEEVPDALP